MNGRRIGAVACAALTSLAMLVPASMAVAEPVSEAGGGIVSSTELKAQAARQATDARQRLLEESTALPESITPMAEDPNAPPAWNEGTDTGMKDLPATVSGVSSALDETVRGVNLTSYQAERNAGVTFRDFDGNTVDDDAFMTLLKDSGVNYVLLKVAVNPADGEGHTYGGGDPTLQNALKTAAAAQRNGLKVNIQFLYSDFHTSKTVQKLPKGWPSGVDELTKKVGEYTASALATLKDGGVVPDMVTIGSEISSPYYDDAKALQGGFLGMDDWKDITSLIAAASKAVRANSSDTLVAVGGSSVTPVLVTTYVDMLKYYQVDYDVLGTKVYAAYDDLTALAQTRRMVAEEYGKSFAVLDTAYPFTQYDSDGQGNTTGASDIAAAGGELTPQGQADYIRRVYKAIVTADNNAGGAGVFYGDATWIAVKAGLWHADENWNAANEYGTGWVSKYAADYVAYAGNGGASQQDDAALFDDLGQPLQSLTVFRQLMAANPDDADLVPEDLDPYESGADTGATAEAASVQSVPTVTDDTIRGADVSSYQALYEAGVRFKNFEGKEESLFKILADNGMNWVRLRLFNDPFDAQGNSYGAGTDDLETVTKMAKEATEYGLRVNVDIHYNDFYASPWRTPKAWKGHDYAQLKKDVYDFTAQFVQTMTDNGVDLGMVQIGNESNCGLAGITVCSNGYSYDQDPNWERLVGLMNEASKAIRKYSPDTQIAVHMMYADSWSTGVIAENFQKYKLDYDVFGMTYYPFWSTGSDGTDRHEPMAALVKSEQIVTGKYNKKFAVMEFSQPFTSSDSDGTANNLSDGGVSDYPASVQGQADVIHDVMETVTQADGGTDLGIGAFYWEPAWIAVAAGTNHWQLNRTYANDHATGWASSYAVDNDPTAAEYADWGGSGWDNQALFDDHGYPLQSLKAFTQVIADRTVSFDTQGGGELASVSVKDGSTVDLPTPTRDGYAFTGWSTDRDGKHAFDSSSTVTADTTLYAQWSANAYTIRFHANDGASEDRTEDQQAAWDQTVALKANAFSREDWTFAGWNRAADGTGESYADGQQVLNLTADKDGVVDLYAMWTPGVVGLRVSQNPSTTSYHVGDMFDPSGIVVTAQLADGSERDLAASEYRLSVPDMGQAGSQMVTVSYLANPAWTASFTIDVDQADRDSLQASVAQAGTLNKDDYTDASWKALEEALAAANDVLADPDASDESIHAAAGQLGTAFSGLVRAYTVAFDSRGGSEVAQQHVADGDRVNEPAAPSRDGYAFNGWSTDEQGSSPYDFSAPVYGALTLYAQWKDAEAPVFQGTDDTSVDYAGDFDPMAGVSAFDTVDGDLTSRIEVKGTVNTGKAGKHTLTYTVSDNAGNTATATRTVTVKPIVFVDVDSSTPHHTDIEWLSAEGISTGWRDTDTGEYAFRGMDSVKRQDMAAFLYRLAGSPEYEANWYANPFTDVDQNTPHAKEILWLASTGVSEGWLESNGTRTFRGMDSVKRQDMAAFLHRLADYLKAKPETGTKLTFKDVDASTPHRDDIAWLASTGVSEGWKESDGSRTFRGMDSVKRQDMAAFLHRMNDNVISKS